MFKFISIFSLFHASLFAQTSFPGNEPEIKSDLFLVHPSCLTAPVKPRRPLLSPATYKITWDIDFSPYSGGEDLLFGFRLIEKCETYLLEKSPLAYSKEAQARTWRLSELLMLWLPLDYLAMVVQHEVFGHGYRIRDIGRSRIQVEGYSFGTPPPYGYGGGSTSYTFDEGLTTTEETSVAMAGVEATAILAELTKFKWLESGRIDPRQSVLYLFSQHDLNMYIGSLKASEGLDGHDIHSYIHSLNYTYPQHQLSGARLRSLAWINLADPFTFYAIYSWFHYLSSGKESKIPMIASCYLPGLRLGLTPFGPEVFFENYFLIKKEPLYAYVKGGNHSGNEYYGLGFYAPRLYSIDKWYFGARVDLWRQPQLLLQPASIPITEINFNEKPSAADPLYPYSEQFAVRYGGAGSVIIFYRGSKRCGFEMEGGYKAQGFLPGYSLRASPVARLAFTLVF